jgi:hypothetical protein
MNDAGLASQRRVGQSLIVTFMPIKVSLAAPGSRADGPEGGSEVERCG